LKPSIPGNKTNFDLSFQDGDDKYAYAGSRTTDDKQYILYFDPKRKALILDRVDSMFNMNLTRTPTSTDPEHLKHLFPQLDTAIKVGVDTRRPGQLETVEKKSSAKVSDGSQMKGLGKARKPEKRKEVKNVELLLPMKPTKPAKTESKRKAQSEDEDEDSGDDGLTIEFPGGINPNRQADFSPAFPTRTFTQFVQDSEADDADGEGDDDLEENNLRLPSPVNHHANSAAAAGPMDIDQPEDDADADADAELDADYDNDLEGDLEAEMEQWGEQEGKAQNGDSESEVSEED
jgi:hypothetical protein